MLMIDALKKLACKLGCNVSDSQIIGEGTTADLVDYIAENYSGGGESSHIEKTYQNGNLVSAVVHGNTIHENELRNCYSLTTITFSDALTTIGAYGLAQCKNLNLILPATIQNVGYRGLEGVEHITFTAKPANWDSWLAGTSNTCVIRVPWSKEDTQPEGIAGNKAEIVYDYTGE
mgnify:CR=1 FL=1